MSNNGERYRQLAREALLAHVQARRRLKGMWAAWRDKHGSGPDEAYAFENDPKTGSVIGDEQLYCRFAQTYALMAIMEKLYEEET